MYPPTQLTRNLYFFVDRSSTTSGPERIVSHKPSSPGVTIVNEGTGVPRTRDQSLWSASLPLTHTSQVRSVTPSSSLPSVRSLPVSPDPVLLHLRRDPEYQIKTESRTTRAVPIRERPVG